MSNWSKVRSYVEDVLNIYRKEGKDLNKEILYTVHKTHDGYDEDGPVSDIYDLMIWDKTGEKVYTYHCEIWFDCRDDDKFYLIQDKSSKEFFNYGQFSKKDFKNI